MSHIVVLGAGIGGVSMTFELREALGKQHKITLVNDNPYFQFTPSNPWVGVGWREKANITVELAPLMKKHGVDFLQASAEKLEPDTNTLRVSQGRVLTYDYLVIATGPGTGFRRDRSVWVRRDIPNRSVRSIMLQKRMKPGRRFATIPARLSLARCRARPVMDLLMNTP